MNERRRKRGLVFRHLDGVLLTIAAVSFVVSAVTAVIALTSLTSIEDNTDRSVQAICRVERFAREAAEGSRTPQGGEALRILAHDMRILVRRCPPLSPRP